MPTPRLAAAPAALTGRRRGQRPRPALPSERPHRLTPPRAPSKGLLLLCLLLYLVAYKTLQDVLEHAAVASSAHSPLRALSSGSAGEGPSSQQSLGAHRWSNPHGVVHVVQTRFMQHQPHLAALAEARLELFRVFCRPLLFPPQEQQQQQEEQQLAPSPPPSSSSSNATFVWQIRIDPDLDPPIVRRLIQLLQRPPPTPSADGAGTFPPSPVTAHVLLIASNDNPRFRHELPDPQLLVWGDYDVWQAYYEAAHTHTLLETRLDADDGLANGFVEQLQRTVQEHYSSSYSSSSASSGAFRNAAGADAEGSLPSALAHPPPPRPSPPMRVYCVDAHLEWHQPAPSEGSSSHSSLSVPPSSSAGTLLGVRTPHCVTPGLTVVSPPPQPGAPDYDPTNAPLKHHLIHKRLPRCPKRRRRRGEEGGPHPPDDRPCYVRFAYQDWPMAIRARTVTSAGMSRVLIHPQGHHHKTPPEWSDRLQMSAWRSLLPSLFGIERDDVLQLVQTYFDVASPSSGVSHSGNAGTGNGTTNGSTASLLALQALEGQCTPGHSCKDGAREALQAMVRAAARKHE